MTSADYQEGFEGGIAFAKNYLLYKVSQDQSEKRVLTDAVELIDSGVAEIRKTWNPVLKKKQRRIAK